MLTKEDKLRQIKQVLVTFLPKVTDAAPWLDTNELQLGKPSGWETQQGPIDIWLYFQQYLDKDGRQTKHYEEAAYYNEIYGGALTNKLRAIVTDPQITWLHTGTWSGIKNNEVLKNSIWGYYGIHIVVKFNEFKIGDIVKVKQDWLNPGEDPDEEYVVIEINSGGHITVKHKDTSIRGIWDWPDYTLYKE